MTLCPSGTRKEVTVFRDIMTGILDRVMIALGRREIRKMHRSTAGARKKNEELLMRILRTNKDCEYGKKYGFSDIKTAEEYRRRLPMTVFDDYQEYITRMIDGGEEGLLTSLPLVGYAQSSGSVGARKFVPLTQPEVNIYVRYTVPKMLAATDEYLRKNRGRGLRPGRGIFTCPAFDDFLPNGLPCSNVADVAARQLGRFYPYILVTPFKKLFNGQEADSKYMNFRLGLKDRDLLFMFSIFFMNFTDLFRYLELHWETLTDDIEKGQLSGLSMASPETRKKMEKLLRPNPERAAELRREFEKGFDKTILERIWPNLSVLYGIGSASFAPFAKIARGYTGKIPYDFSIYGASEGLFAATDQLEDPKQLLLVDSCYYEFIPEEEPDRILSLDELEEGREYEIVITNQSGLYRYRCGDVIRVVGYMNECPYVQFSYRKGQLLNMTGEKTTEEHMAAVVKEISRISGCNVTDWAVSHGLDSHPYRYMLLLENPEGRDLSGYSAQATEILKKVNPRFEVFFNEAELGPMTIHNLEYGTQLAWRDLRVSKGTAVTQYKPVRILDTPEKQEFFLSRIKN